MARSLTYGEHMRWCKDRALAYLDRGEVHNAFASFASDVKKHPETDNATVTLLLAGEGMRCATFSDAKGMRRLIEGFASD